MPNAAPSPWRMFLPLAIVLLLAALWTAYWFVASGIARDRLSAERAHLAEQGFTLICTEEKWGGYPFHFEVSCSSPILAQGGRAELRSGNLLLVALAYAPWQVVALLDGPTTLTAPGLSPARINHERALVAVTLDKSGQPSFSAEMRAVSADGIGKADKLMLFTRPAAGGGTDIAVDAVNVVYLAEGKPPLEVDEAKLQGALTNNRTFELEKLELIRGPLRYWGKGTLALDGQNRLTGQIETETNDIKGLLAVAGPQLGLSDDKLANLRTVLGLLGNGAKAPVIAKDGVLYLGPFQITELRPLY